MSDVDLQAAVPSAPMSARFRRRLAVLVGLAALSAAVLSWVEADSGRQEEQAFVDASRGALDIFVRIAGSSPRDQFLGSSLRRGVLVEAEATARVVTAPNGRPIDLAIARSKPDERAGRRLQEVASAMSKVPGKVPRLDPAALEVLRTDTSKLGPVVRAQNRAVDRADEYGTRQERGMFALGLIAIAASLLGLAALMGDGAGGRISMATAAGALMFALLAGASGFVV